MSKVWVVANGTGGQIDSVWSDRDFARQRAEDLNEPGGIAMLWTVQEFDVREKP